MSLSRSLSRFLSSQRWPLLRSSSFCTETQTPSPIRRTYRRNAKPSVSNFPKPSEIPFQVKVANCVHLVGSIGVPVQLRTLPCGIYAVAILVQQSKEKNSPQLW